MNEFHENILRIVRSIPHGKVVSYGQVAAYTGDPKVSREVGWAMQELGDTADFPWWRVLNSVGKISLSDNPKASPEMQQQLLEKESVGFIEPLVLDIEHYRYRANKEALKNFGLSLEHIEEVFEKYSINQLPLL